MSIYISSKKRANNQGLHNITRFSIGNLGHIDPNVRSVCISNVCIPFSQNTFTSSKNVIIFRETGEAKDVVARIPEGNYNLATICRAIAEAMTSVGQQVYNVVPNIATNSLTISSIENFELLWEFNKEATCWERLGFELKNSGMLANSYTGTRPFNGNPSGIYRLTVDGLSGASIDFRLLLTGESYQIAEWKNNREKYVSLRRTVDERGVLSNQVSSQLNVFLSDEDGNDVRLLSEWSFDLQFSNREV